MHCTAITHNSKQEFKMLLQMQINMLKTAAALDMQHIVTIYKMSLQHNDFDTADYILEHYKHKFNAAQTADVEAFVFAIAPADVLAAAVINNAMH
jgi:hypothetical protein